MLQMTTTQTTAVAIVVAITVLLLGSQLISAWRDVRVAKWTGQAPAKDREDEEDQRG